MMKGKDSFIIERRKRGKGERERDENFFFQTNKKE